MKKIFSGAALLTLMSFAVNAPLPIGGVMPKADVKLKDVSGKEITIKETAKKKWRVGNVQL
jgi:hypothetical protein